jgi:hypothetical protein
LSQKTIPPKRCLLELVHVGSKKWLFSLPPPTPNDWKSIFNVILTLPSKHL